MSSSSRMATHSGSWYTSNAHQLSKQLDDWLFAVPNEIQPIGAVSSTEGPLRVPSDGARVIIAPHAGYSYSGPAAAWAYKSLDVKNVKRVFILGPSHHHYLTGCALSECKFYETPLGSLKLDLDTISELHNTGQFDVMSHSVDEAEHSIEMQLPYTAKMLSRAFSNPAEFPPIIPILVGNTSGGVEKQYGALLAPYLADPTSVFIVSSDFAHWGSRFRYTYYQPNDGDAVRKLGESSRAPTNPPIHESIEKVDLMCVEAIQKGEHKEFLDVLKDTGNTVCGRHPIGIVMAAIEELKREGELAQDKGKFKFVRYDRSSEVVSVRDSSVSYCSGFAVM